jgi:DNA-binding Lrp family transcriptional regulator
MGDVDEGDRRGVDRLTIQEAARRLGISEGAVRKRVTRGSLKHEKEDDGRVYVYLDAGGRRRVDAGQDEGVDPNSNALISQLRDEVVYLRDENRRKDEIIMQQAMTMRQLTAAPSQEPPGDAETVEEAPEGAEPRSATAEAQDELGAERARRETAETVLHDGMAEERRRREAAERERDDLRRELYARREPRVSPQTVEEAPDRAGPGPQSATGGAQEGARRPWWRRVFRG